MKNIFKQTGLLVLILTFSMASSTAVNAQTNDQELTYVKVEVKGLACPFCAYGLEKKLKEEDGVKSIKIDVEESINSLIVRDISGKTVLNLGVVNSNYLDIAFLKEGVYILTISTDNFVGTAKFIKH